jgi:GT2 family glycosyltransferase
MAGVTVSVIVPTYRRPDDVVQCVGSLQDQDAGGFETIVVDNACDEALRRRIDEVDARGDGRIRYVAEPNVGLHNARHAGVRAAEGELLLFTDDDAVFSPGWVSAYAEAFDRHPEMVAAGGPVHPIWEGTPPAWLLEMVERSPWCGPLSLIDLDREFVLDPEGMFFGVNMAIRRSTLFEVGGFNPEAFGPVWLGDGETGLNRKLWDRGLPIGYVPGALAYHRIPPGRMRHEYLLHRIRNEAASDAYAEYHPGLPSRGTLLADGLGYLGRAVLYRAATVVPVRRRSGPRGGGRRGKAAYNGARARYASRLVYRDDLRRLVAHEDWLNSDPHRAQPSRPPGMG